MTSRRGEFLAGSTIVHNEVLDGRVWCSYPVRVIADEPELLAVRVAQGAPMSFGRGPFRWGDHPWKALGDRWLSPGVVQLQRPGDYYSVWVMSHPRTGAFDGWYVNFQEPFTRHAEGIDTLDYMLDIVVRPCGEYRWKDEDEFEAAAAGGAIAPDRARAVRRAAEAISADLDSGRLWWDDTRWSRWSGLDDGPVSAGAPAGPHMRGHR